MSDRDLIQAVSSIPHDEQWMSQDAEAAYQELAKRMVRLGVSPEESVDILESAYLFALNERLERS